MRTRQSEEDLNPTFFEEVVPIVGGFRYINRNFHLVEREPRESKRRLMYDRNFRKIAIIQSLEIALPLAIIRTYL